MYNNFNGTDMMGMVRGWSQGEGWTRGGHMMYNQADYGVGQGFMDGFSAHGPLWMLGFIFGFIVVILAVIWTIAIKGFALWHSAKRNEKWWFIALLIINTFGILELVYLIFYAKVLFQGKFGKKISGVSTSSSESSEKSGVESAVSEDSAK
jgi:methionyl-tRNA synthetase